MGRRPVGHGRPRLLAAVFVAVAMLAAPTLAPAVTTPATPVDHTRAVNVNPPGENGFVPGTDTGWIKYALNGGYPYNESKTNFGYPSPHTVDQIGDYWHADPNRRIFPGYKDANFYDPAHPGAGDTVERPGPGPATYRDP